MMFDPNEIVISFADQVTERTVDDILAESVVSPEGATKAAEMAT